MHMCLQVSRHSMMARPLQLVRAEILLQPPLAAVPPGHTCSTDDDTSDGPRLRDAVHGHVIE